MKRWMGYVHDRTRGEFIAIGIEVPNGHNPSEAIAREVAHRRIVGDVLAWEPTDQASAAWFAFKNANKGMPHLEAQQAFRKNRIAQKPQASKRRPPTDPRTGLGWVETQVKAAAKSCPGCGTPEGGLHGLSCPDPRGVRETDKAIYDISPEATPFMELAKGAAHMRRYREELQAVRRQTLYEDMEQRVADGVDAMYQEKFADMKISVDPAMAKDMVVISNPARKMGKSWFGEMAAAAQRQANQGMRDLVDGYLAGKAPVLTIHDEVMTSGVWKVPEKAGENGYQKRTRELREQHADLVKPEPQTVPWPYNVEPEPTPGPAGLLMVAPMDHRLGRFA